MLNTCHDCFPETIIEKQEKEFNLKIFPEDVHAEDIRPQKNNFISKIFDKIKIKKNYFSSKNDKCLLNDVPSQSMDSFQLNNNHYHDQLSEINNQCIPLIHIRPNKSQIPISR